jgi:hypothetical protein
VTEPGSASTSPGGVCIPCTTGQLQVRVFLQTLCWDTDPALGENTPDRPFTGVSVSISGGTEKPPQTTDGSGLVKFEGLSPGSYTISASKPGFSDDTAEVLSYCSPVPAPGLDAQMLAGRQEVKVHETAKAVRVMRRQLVSAATPEAPKGRECSRKHSKLPGGSPGSRWIFMPVFWVFSSEPWIMVLRDLLWLACMVTIPIAAAKGNVALAAWAAAFFAYLSTVTFGQTMGVVLMVAAFATFGVAMVMATMQRMFGGHPSAAWVAFMSATWAGFTWGLARGRRPRYFNTEKLEIMIGGVLGLAVAIVLYFLFGGSFDTPSGVLDGIGEVLVALVMLAVAFGSGAGGALFPHTFTNENKLDPVVRWLEGFKLPYAGEHYCVQGHRGFISHSRLNAGQEYSYDWEFPLGKPILAAKEGHIISVEESQDGFQGIKMLGLQVWGSGNTTPNEVKVRHTDGSVANYLHLRKNGVSEISVAAEAAVGAEPLHVYEGQQIAAAGNVGISMFSHLHFMVDRAVADRRPDDERGPVKFSDGDTARHEKRCYSMRKYKSSNVDRGPMRATANHPPFKPGGPPTTGEPYPVPAGAAGGGGGGLFDSLPGSLPGGMPGGMPGGLPEGMPPIPGGAPPTAMA